MKYPHPDPLQHPGQTLVLLQAKQIADLAQQCKTLAAMLAAKGLGVRGKGPGKDRDPERERRRGLTLSDYLEGHFLTERSIRPGTAELMRACLKRAGECFGRDLKLREISPGTLPEFRNWLARQTASIDPPFRPATANKHLRCFRSLLRHAASAGVIRRPRPAPMLTEPERDVMAWTPRDLAMLENQAQTLQGPIPKSPIPAAIFWLALVRLFQTGCRPTALLLAQRSDYDPQDRTLLLRRENQKQKKDQRIALPDDTITAVEALLALHEDPRILPWPFDPPKKNGERKWKVLAKYFEQLVVIPAGLTLAKGVKFRQFRRTVATIVDETGGDAQKLLGHDHASTTEGYKDRRRKPACREAMRVSAAKRAAMDAQRVLF